MSTVVDNYLPTVYDRFMTDLDKEIRQMDEQIARISDAVDRSLRSLKLLEAARSELAQGFTPDMEQLERQQNEDVGAATGRKAFTRKYAKRAEDYVVAALQEAGRPLTVSQIWHTLSQQGKDYVRQSINLALRKLVKAGTVKKVSADDDAASTWAFEAVEK